MEGTPAARGSTFTASRRARASALEADFHDVMKDLAPVKNHL